MLLTERLPSSGEYWTADLFQGRALAYMGLNNWEAALTDINAALSHRAAGSRNKDALSLGEVEMHFAKSTILKKLGRDVEAEKERTIAEQGFAFLEAQAPDSYWLGKMQTGSSSSYGEKPPSYARYGVPVGVYDELLKSIRLKLEEGEK
mgnify:CR=1 FL=1